MGQPHEPEPGSEDPEATPPSGQPAGGDDDEPTEPLPDRWKGSATVPPPDRKRRRRGVLREPTAELPALEEEPWPPPPPPRPADAPVTAPYPPPRPPAWTPQSRPPRTPHPPVIPYPAGYRRRRRRWPWVLTTFVLLLVLCCGCCIGWILPYAEEYPASASLPPQAAGLAKLDDPASVAASKLLEGKIRAQHWLAEDVFAAIYAEPRTGQRRVVIFGATLFIFDPENTLKDAFGGLDGELNLTEVRSVPAGPAGGYQRCGKGVSGGETVTVCGWADHGSIAIGIFSSRAVDQSASLLRDLRAQIITRDNS